MSKPLLIFGLRGTLLERVHVRRLPQNAPKEDLTVGLSKVWLRPGMVDTLLTLQNHCRLAVWSSTTARNTTPLIEAVFQDASVFDIHNEGKKNLKPPIKFEFVWTREHTVADDFRRSSAVVRDDEHATLKDLSSVFRQYAAIANEKNTVLIDDTPSKARMHADNYLWLDSCEGDGIKDTKAMKKLQDFVLQELLETSDVRDVLPRRIRRG
ncbi:hypothetical protein AGDE_02220 [Angomonas deanei]|uniref:Mitochondrial import inner membrane translocase subunit TIM50 n=1 Tax=Angomonas deanei TaxID=59799 RepID=S9UWK3_9TRYP|nr:hypothetical protein AGDE_07504 [Angomonas deanei]EPY39115.1 hypothetical protein AGDE_04814 [Angomonas deanei]EPY41704.1 hypothetical protein AGDE_02220 [Angomonas deanei]CAD2219374.1 NLI interacting factor-like phosphatase, putative [Angomonas deanei]|eukprot:EPY35267.1 hypothetical protein AGDE_07504 [Angomonas deanei]